jgi:hypothetical protein
MALGEHLVDHVEDRDLAARRATRRTRAKGLVLAATRSSAPMLPARKNGVTPAKGARCAHRAPIRPRSRRKTRAYGCGNPARPWRSSTEASALIDATCRNHSAGAVAFVLPVVEPVRFHRLDDPEFHRVGRHFGICDTLDAGGDGPLCFVLETATPTTLQLVRALAREWFPTRRIVMSVGPLRHPSPPVVRESSA